MAKRKRSAKGSNAEPRQAVSLAAMPTDWDHGATGPANRAGLVVETIADADPATGKVTNPNGVRRARRVDMLDAWHRKGDLTTAQFNTAVMLRAAFEAMDQMPGTDYARPRVDSSPKPDHAITIQIDRQSKLHRVLRNVSAADMPIIEHCAIRGLTPATFRIGLRRPYYGAGYAAGMRALRDALDRAGL